MLTKHTGFRFVAVSFVAFGIGAAKVKLSLLRV